MRWFRVRIDRETILGVVFIATSLVVVICAVSGVFPLAFWVAAGIGLAIAAVSKQPFALIAATILFVGARLAIGALATGRRELVIGAGVAALALAGIWRWTVRREYVAGRALVDGRPCPSCGADLGRSKLARGLFNDRRDEQLRVLAHCACGEYTLFDGSGAGRHVDPPTPEGAV